MTQASISHGNCFTRVQCPLLSPRKERAKGQLKSHQTSFKNDTFTSKGERAKVDEPSSRQWTIPADAAACPTETSILSLMTTDPTSLHASAILTLSPRKDAREIRAGVCRGMQRLDWEVFWVGQFMCMYVWLTTTVKTLAALMWFMFCIRHQHGALLRSLQAGFFFFCVIFYYLKSFGCMFTKCLCEISFSIWYINERFSFSIPKSFVYSVHSKFLKKDEIKVCR